MASNETSENISLKMGVKIAASLSVVYNCINKERMNYTQHKLYQMIKRCWVENDLCELYI